MEENELVYYELGQPSSTGFSTMSTTSSDVSVNTPFGAYDSVNGYYEIWGGFNFTNDNAWWGEAVNWGGYANPTGSIGGNDVLGINLDGGTNGAALKSFFMQPLYHDAPGNAAGGYTGDYSAAAITNRVGTLSSNVGAMFMFQDKSVGFGLGSDGYAKYAYNFGAGAVKLAYDSSFAQASGNACVYYRHTWDHAGVTGVTLNSDGTFSVNVSKISESTPTLIGADYHY